MTRWIWEVWMNQWGYSTFVEWCPYQSTKRWKSFKKLTIRRCPSNKLYERHMVTKSQRNKVYTTKTHPSALHAFVEFECRFAQLLELDEWFLGACKVLMFVKSINQTERKAIGVQLEDDDGVNGLIENCVEWHFIYLLSNYYRLILRL